MDKSGVDRFSGAVNTLFVDDFDTGIEGWVFINGDFSTSTPGSAGGALTITYNNTMGFSYWQRPFGTTPAQPSISPLEADTLYRVIANVTSSIAPSATAFPDFRLSTHLSNGASESWFLSSFLSNGGADFISPNTTPRDYTVYFEAFGVPSGTAQTSDLVLQFEGFNFPWGGRPNFIGTSMSLNRIQLDEVGSANIAGTPVHTIDVAADFAQGSGTLNGWLWGLDASLSGPGFPVPTWSFAPGNDGLVITSPTFASTDYYSYGAFDASPFLATGLPDFSGNTLYRATFKITTTAIGNAMTNCPTPQMRIQAGDSHLAIMANLYSNFGAAGNTQVTGDELTTGSIDIWWYYPGPTRADLIGKKLYPSFEFRSFGPFNPLKMPNGAALTLRHYDLSQQVTP